MQIILIGVCILVLVVLSLFIFTKSSISEKESYDGLSGLTLKEREVAAIEFASFQEFLFKKDGFYDQVHKELQEQGYEYGMFVTMYSKNVTWVKFALANKEATREEREEIESTFYDLVKKNNLDEKAFKVRVRNDDSPDW